MLTRRRNLFTIAPGAPFLKTFVSALLNGEIVPALSRETPPLTMARATIYVPTQRAARALSAEFAQALDRRATLLPRILPLGALEEGENAALFGADFDVADAPLGAPIEELERRLLLSQLILQWAEALGRAIISIDATGAPNLHESEPLLVAATPSAAYTLAADLGALIDELHIENVSVDAFGTLSDDAYSDFWAITTQFLQIALREWPQILAERGRIDASAYLKRLIEAQITELNRSPPATPVIALGSTGTQPTTTRLLATIASLENGAVVLPGLDQIMSADAWASVGHTEKGGESAFTHPQTMLKRLLATMGAARDEPCELTQLTPALAARRAFVSQAMAPAEATSAWRDYQVTHSGGFAEALEGVIALEAPDERLEALSLALFMREALETTSRTAALVTPDRLIARRVAAELRRFDIEVDDSGGMPLARTSIGALARLVATIGSDRAGAVNVAALLAHPLTALGLSSERVSALAPLIEVGRLRTFAQPDCGWAPRVAAARELARAPHAHPAARRISDDDWLKIEDALERIDAAFAPLAALAPTASLSDRARAHRVAFEAVISGADECGDEGATALFELFDRLTHAEAPEGFDAQNYVALFDRILSETMLRGPRRAHPRLKILGPLEARLIDADLILLAGLDEGVWPPQTDTGAFLNRSMRAQLGLMAPERRIGQSAHDFIMALGAKRVVLSRAIKRDGAPTVPSRFIARLSALAGDAFDDCKKRGDAMLTIAAALDRPKETMAIERPQPRPPLALRPQRLSVTRIERLRRDPYAIFAEYVLKLTPLPLMGTEAGTREIGMAIHEALAEFVMRHPHGALPCGARDTLLYLAREKLNGFMSDSAFVSFQWPRIEAGLGHALGFEQERRALNCEIHVETRGEMALTLADGSTFHLTAIADRIELDRQGQAYVFDYKTGAPPSNKQVKVGWSPQLTLEAAMIEAGAFEKVGAPSVACAAYIGLRNGGKTQWLEWTDARFAEVVAAHRVQLQALLSQFRDESMPYASRPHPAFTSDVGDYDHLARVREWMRGGGEPA
ncbi:double-strand break repair protein AddB [Methylocystis sp. B8]|uniref:double-strand break repair protein AddB n=1 Tax=Methylocystis sp. B8 TaxID=544938 RepID=UPI0010FD0A79|nr:double-strand break repair protein AddB [Methylocystis sp. B8]TLG72192.1 double-strand break repair protein AddB [Methylocystis sp. B8]